MNGKLNIAIAALVVAAMLAVAIPSIAEPSDAAADASIIGYGSSTGSIEYVLYSEGVQDHDDYGALVIKFRSAPVTETMNVTVAGVAYPMPVPVKNVTKIALPWTLSESTTAYKVAVAAAGYSASCDLTVGTATMVPNSVSISTGATKDLKVMVGASEVEYGGDIAWSTGSASVATVADGTVTGVGAGNTTITATITKAYGTTVDKTCSVTISGPSPPGPGPGPTPTTNYTVTFAVSPTNAGNFVQGTTVVTSIQVASGTAFTVTGNVMTFGSGTTAKDVTAVASAGYEFDHWSDTSGTITADKTITAVFKEVAQPITKTVAYGSVTLPASVVEALGIKDASKLVLTIEKVTPKAGNIPSDAVCYEVTLKYDGKALTSFPSEIDVLLKYAIPAGKSVSDLKVFYVSDDGKTVENMNGIYDAGEQGMFFKTRHLSVFAVTDQTIAPVTISSISVKTAPSKVSYTVGDKFDPTGLVITATYSDGKTEDVSYSGHESAFGFVPSLSIALKVTDKSITITYEGKSTSQAITVSEAPSPSGGGYDTMMYVIIAIVVIVLIAAVAFFVIKKRP